MKIEKVLEELNIGDQIFLGKFRNKKAFIKDFGVDKLGQPTVKTNKGERNMYAFRLQKALDPEATEEYEKFYHQTLVKYKIDSPKELNKEDAKKFWLEIEFWKLK